MGEGLFTPRLNSLKLMPSDILRDDFRDLWSKQKFLQLDKQILFNASLEKLLVSFFLIVEWFFPETFSHSHLELSI